MFSGNYLLTYSSVLYKKKLKFKFQNLRITKMTKGGQNTTYKIGSNITTSLPCGWVVTGPKLTGRILKTKLHLRNCPECKKKSLENINYSTYILRLVKIQFNNNDRTITIRTSQMSNVKSFM
jgi:hypothetical protein